MQMESRWIDFPCVHSGAWQFVSYQLWKKMPYMVSCFHAMLRWIYEKCTSSVVCAMCQKSMQRNEKKDYNGSLMVCLSPLLHFQRLCRERGSVSRQRRSLQKALSLRSSVSFSAAAAAAATALPGFNNFSRLSLIKLHDSSRDSNWSVSGGL